MACKAMPLLFNYLSQSLTKKTAAGKLSLAGSTFCASVLLAGHTSTRDFPSNASQSFESKSHFHPAKTGFFFFFVLACKTSISAFTVS